VLTIYVTAVGMSMAVWISPCIRDKWKVVPQTLYLAGSADAPQVVVLRSCVPIACGMEACTEHLLVHLNILLWWNFLLPQECLQLKFIDECRFLMVLTVLTWALCITGPDGWWTEEELICVTYKEVMTCEASWIEIFQQLLSCHESEDEEFLLWQPVKHGCITMKPKPIQSMEYYQKGSPTKKKKKKKKKKKFKTPRLGQERSWLHFFLWCRCCYSHGPS